MEEMEEDFYDGGQLFHYATCDLWGLFTSIVNLPPAYREMSCRGRGGKTTLSIIQPFKNAIVPITKFN